MNSDLEAQLAALGPDYRTVVDRLVEAYRPTSFPADAVPCSGPLRLGRLTGWSVGYLAAASLLVVAGLAVLFSSFSSKQVAQSSEYLLAHLHSDAAVNELLRTQHADGSWQNDFLTRQNALALKNRTDASSRIAYKKAMRNLRCRGLL